MMQKQDAENHCFRPQTPDKKNQEGALCAHTLMCISDPTLHTARMHHHWQTLVLFTPRQGGLGECHLLSSFSLGKGQAK